jgi:hypothetical protein
VPNKHDLWEVLIEKLALDVSRPVNYLTASEIKVTIHEEPRLMASMDSERSVPEFLRKNGLFVLPVSRSRYALVRGKGYHELEDPGEPVPFEVRLPIDLTSLAYGRGESRYLLHAYHAGLLSQFSGVPQMYPTVSGKMATGTFRFHVDGSPELEVTRAGMEVDFGFEGPDDLLLFEGKAGARDTFLVRQLYYPFRTFREVTPKRVRPFFFVSEPDEGTYSLWEYEWVDYQTDDYEAIRFRNAQRFRLTEARAPTDALAAVSPDPSLAKVPQADDLDKVAEFPFRVLQGVSTTHEWARLKGIADRQGQYYREAAEALGLISMEGRKLTLNAEGRRFVEMPPQQRGDLLALRILRNPVMNEVFHAALARKADGLGDSDVADIIRRLSHLGGSTPLRRAQTVRAYFAWLSKTTGTVVVEGRRIYSREAWDGRGRPK